MAWCQSCKREDEKKRKEEEEAQMRKVREANAREQVNQLIWTN